MAPSTTIAAAPVVKKFLVFTVDGKKYVAARASSPATTTTTQDQLGNSAESATRPAATPNPTASSARGQWVWTRLGSRRESQTTVAPRPRAAKKARPKYQ